MTDNLTGGIEHEHAPIRVRPNHFPPGKCGDNLRRPDGLEQWRRLLPSNMAHFDLDVTNHFRFHAWLSAA